ncbi:MAG: hypothetical protein AAGC44_12875 [Planctomycetota bacterium]
MLFRIVSFTVIPFLLVACRSAPTTTRQPDFGDVDWQSRVVVFEGSEFLAPEFAGEQEKYEQTRDALHQPVTCLFQSADFSEVLGQVRQQTGLNIMVNWPILEVVGVVPDTPVTIGLDEVPAEHLLKYAVAMASAEQFDDDKAGYEIIDGVIYISTLAEIKTHTVTRVYDLRPVQVWHAPDIRLLYDDEDEAIEYARTLMGEIELRPENKPEPQAIAEPDGLFGDDDDTYGSRRREVLEQITELIVDTVGTQNEWLDEASTLREVNGWLIVRTTRTNHRQIEAMLTAMHRSQTARFQRKARLVEVFGLLKEAEAYRLDQRYVAALRKIDQALRVDPQNAEALALREIVVGAMRP